MDSKDIDDDCPSAKRQKLNEDAITSEYEKTEALPLPSSQTKIKEKEDDQLSCNNESSTQETIQSNSINGDTVSISTSSSNDKDESDPQPLADSTQQSNESNPNDPPPPTSPPIPTSSSSVSDLEKPLVPKKKVKKKKLKNVKGKTEPTQRRAGNHRKNIKDILTTEHLGDETLAAQREEAERRERMNLKLQQLKSAAAAATRCEPPESLISEILDNLGHSEENTPFEIQPTPPIEPIPDQLLSCIHPTSDALKNEEIVLSSDEEEAPQDFPLVQQRGAFSGKPHNEISEENIISISSGEEEEDNSCDREVESFNLVTPIPTRYLPQQKQQVKLKPNPTMEDESDDDCVVISPTPEKEEKEEKNIDELNVPDELGRILVNVGRPEEDPDIFLAPQIARIVKPHQIGGIRFLYDNVVESADRFNTASGFGCILAHSMGLGKTLQAVSFCDVFFRATTAKTILIIVPINTIQNWLNEFNVWLPPQKSEIKRKRKRQQDQLPPAPCKKDSSNKSSSFSLGDSISETVSLNLSFDSTLNLLNENETENEENVSNGNSNSDFEEEVEINPRKFEVFVLNETVKTLQAREKIISEWKEKGGVMLIGYEMYRMLALKKLKKSSKKQNTFFELQRAAEESSLENIYSCIVNPGPDLVICDEGHRIKNSGASISQALKAIRTRRRVVLTGYPLQNNLMEYWCMVDFIRPNYLGSKVEFSNMFERPISNGQCVDSTPEDKRLMRFRSHVLHSLLEGFVQRRSHDVLHDALPEKQEWVFLLKMTPIQYQLYKEFIRYLQGNSDGPSGANPIKAFAVCCKIWNHPDCLYETVKKHKSILEDLEDFQDIVGYKNGDSRKGGKGRKGDAVPQISFFDGSGFNIPKNHIGTSYRSGTEALSLDWAVPIFENYTPGVLENGVKFEVLFHIVKESVAMKDKLLVFSQTLLSLDLVEAFFQQKFNWSKNAQYYRLDGSTTGLEREKLIKNFNTTLDVFVFLVSTRAGSLGINLTGANRVVVLDCSWNPCHDCQAVCRIYRYGQTKPCQIYRFVSDCTLEKRIYDRQINKRGMSDRVVDEMNPNAQFKSKDVSSFLVLDHDILDKLPYVKCDLDPEKYSDPILRAVAIQHGDKLTQQPFEHESLLIDQKSQRLSATEKRLAHRNYQNEKRSAELQTASGYSYTRPSYTAFYARDNSASSSSYSSRSSSSYNSSAISSIPSSVSNYKSRPIEDRFELHVPALRSKGICVQSIVLKKDSFLQDPSGGPPMFLRGGEKIFVLRSQKGTYLRISNGKLIAVRNNASNTRYPILNVPPSQELSREQLQALVYSFFSIPGQQQQQNYSYDLKDGSGSKSSFPLFGHAHPTEQHLPPSANFYSHGKNHLQVTNSRNISGGNVTLWDSRHLSSSSQNASNESPEFSKPQNLNDLLDGKCNSNLSYRNPLEKLSFLTSRFPAASASTLASDLQLLRQQRISDSPTALLPSFSNYPNLTVQSLPATSTTVDLEVIPLSSTNGGIIPPQYSNSPSKSRDNSNDTNPSFYEDFTITMKNPSTQHAGELYQPQNGFDPTEFPRQASDVNSPIVQELSRNLSQYYNYLGNSSSDSNSSSFYKQSAECGSPYFPDAGT